MQRALGFLKKRWLDVAIIAILVLQTAALFIIIYSPKSFNSLEAEVVFSSGEKTVLKLYEYGEEEELMEIKGEETMMTLGLKKNAIRVKESGCPSQFCVSTGWVSSPGRSIVCLHNKVTINVIDWQEEVDVVV